jgi:hypothetical protein
LDRLTIFLAESRRRPADTTSSVEWLSQEGNFVLAEVRELKARYVLKMGKVEHQHLEVSLDGMEGVKDDMGTHAR